MTIQQGQVTSFKVELFKAIHDFTTTTGDVFYMALYEATADLGPSTTVYSATGEVSGTGYTAGGKPLTNVTPGASGTTAVVSFDNVSWTGASFTARGALIYNSTKSNKAVCVLDFGADKTAAGTTFLVTMPSATADTAILRYE